MLVKGAAEVIWITKIHDALLSIDPYCQLNPEEQISVKF